MTVLGPKSKKFMFEIHLYKLSPIIKAAVINLFKILICFAFLQRVKQITKGHE